MGTAALSSVWSLPTLASTEARITAKIDASQQRPPISELIYGGFIEHIGNLINHSLWSEVLDDRKFYYGVIEKPEIPPEDPRARRRFVRKWSAVGPPAAITLDKQDPYVGDHSPKIELDNTSSGITQTGLALKPSRYNGRLVLATEGNVAVRATLVWGPGAEQQQTVRIPSSKKWRTRKFEFSVPSETEDASLEIIGEGTGSLRIGAVSLMPADNIHGFRADTLALMRDMDCKILRMPGGNFVSAYDWQNTIGDPDKRPPIFDPVWKAVQPNDVGVDELLQFCELINCQPFWCVNTGFGEPRSGAELVEYVNGPEKSFWGSRRATNGHKKPYQVKYWAVGNEMYGHWQYGHMSREQYVVKHNLFVDAMREVDPDIYIVAPGGFVDEMTTGQGIFIAGQPRVEVASERDWAYGMLEHCWGNFDALGTHAYPPQGKRFNLETGKLFDVDMTLLESSRQPADRIRTMFDAWEDYKKLFPKLNDGKVKVFFDEWAYRFVDDLQGSLAIALAFHEFFRHTDFIDMAGYTMATGWLDYTRTQSTLSTRGLLFQFYQRNFGTVPVAVDGTRPQPAPQYPIGGDQPRVNSGSPTYPLDVSAALSTDKKTLNVAVVNATEDFHTLELEFLGLTTAAQGQKLTFTGAALSSKNAVAKAPEIAIMEADFLTNKKQQKIAPISVSIFQYPLS